MGWTSGWHSKNDVIEHVSNSWNDKVKTLKTSLRGSQYWMLMEYVEGNRKGEQFIALYLIKKCDNYWGYKDMDESCSPYYFNCPLGFIQSAEKSTSSKPEMTLQWYQNVKTYHDKQKEKRSRTSGYSTGDVVELYGIQYCLINKFEGRRGWEVKDINTGARYRMTLKQVGQATLVDVQTSQAA